MKNIIFSRRNLDLKIMNLGYFSVILHIFKLFSQRSSCIDTWQIWVILKGSWKFVRAVVGISKISSTPVLFSENIWIYTRVPWRKSWLVQTYDKTCAIERMDPYLVRGKNMDVKYHFFAEKS